MKTLTDKQCKDLHIAARAAGLDAVEVSVDTDGGPCGFGWINVKPVNSNFGKWLIANKVGCKSHHEGGVNVFVSEFRQSIIKKLTYAYAYAQVLNEAGIKAHGNSLID